MMSAVRKLAASTCISHEPVGRLLTGLSVETQSNGQSALPQSNVKSALPQSNVQSALPQSNVESALPQSNVESALPQSNVESALPQSNVQSEMSHSNVQSALPQSNVQSVLPQSNGRRPKLKIIPLMCKNMFSSFEGACRVNLPDSTLVPQTFLDDIQSAVKECLQDHAITNKMQELHLQPQEIPLDQVRREIANYIRLPGENRESVDYAKCDVKGQVNNNQIKICLTVNFYTTQDVSCKELKIDHVMGLALDNSSVNVHVAEKREDDSNSVTITRL